MNIEVLAQVKSVILILGETGTGKTTIAKKIHDLSARKHRPFICVDLAAISENLLESELFGHCKGSFTGAIQDKKGYLSEVMGGTLFLDEIGELKPKLQKKLLRMIESKTYSALGSTSIKKFEGTIIVATNKDLYQEVLKENFREDLFFRLNVFTFKLKALRENTQLLAKSIEKLFCLKRKELLKNELILTQRAKEKLMEHSWPGNYRELNNTLEYLVVVSNEKVCSTNIPSFNTKPILQNTSPLLNSQNYYDALALFEKEFLTENLTKFHGKINKTSEVIGISKTTLISKLKKYDIKVSNIKLNVKKGQVVGF